MARSTEWFTLGLLVLCLFLVAAVGPAHSAEGAQHPTDQRVRYCGYKWKRLICKSRYDQVADFRWACKFKKSRYGCPSVTSANRFADA